MTRFKRTPSNFKDRVDILTSSIEDLHDEINQIKRQWIEANHPVNIGDIVTVNDYSFEGKPMLVDNVQIRDKYGDPEWTASGFVLKKDGTPSRNRSWWKQKIKKEEF